MDRIIDVAARARRTVWRASLSFQLSGIPVTVEPLRHLCDRFDAQSSFFRPRVKDSVQRHHLGPDEAVLLDVIAFVAENNELETDPEDREWAVGVVAKNPFSGMPRSDIPEWWPELADSELILCALRSWHLMGDPKKTYRLWRCEEAWTSDALVSCPAADWDDEREVDDSDAPPRIRRDRPPRSVVTLDAPSAESPQVIEILPDSRRGSRGPAPRVTDG